MSYFVVSKMAADGLRLLTLYTELILGLRPANEWLYYFVTTSLIGWVNA